MIPRSSKLVGNGVLKTPAQHESLVGHGDQRHLPNGENGLRPLHEKRAVCLTRKLVFALRLVGYSSSSTPVLKRWQIMECIEDDLETAERLADCVRTATRSRSRLFVPEIKN